MKISGIYKIINKINRKYYVGSSCNIRERWKSHRCNLRKNRHHNQHLQNAWNKYEEPNFDFAIVEQITEKDLLIFEQKYLDIAKTESNKCYNISYSSDRKKLSESTRQKLRKIVKTPEWRNKLRLANLGKKLSPEHIQKIKIVMKGKGNPRFDSTVRQFQNKNTRETFAGTMFDFCNKYQLHRGNVCQMVKGNYYSVKSWILNTPMAT